MSDISVVDNDSAVTPVYDDLLYEVDGPVAPIVDAALARGLVIGTAGSTTLRLTPPLTLSTDEADQAISLLTEVLA